MDTEQTPQPTSPSGERLKYTPENAQRLRLHADLEIARAAEDWLAFDRAVRALQDIGETPNITPTDQAALDAWKKDQAALGFQD